MTAEPTLKRVKIPGAGTQLVSQATEPAEEPFQRNPDGTIKKGTVLNPNGRPKNADSIAVLLRVDPRMPEVRERLMFYATDRQFGAWKPEVQVTAIKDVLDRAYGKPIQQVDLHDDAQGDYRSFQLQLLAHFGVLTQAINTPDEDSADVHIPPAPTNAVDAEYTLSAPPQTYTDPLPAVPAPRSRGRPAGASDKTKRKSRARK